MDIQYVGAVPSSVEISVGGQRDTPNYHWLDYHWLADGWAHIRRRASGQASVHRVDN